MSDKKWTKGIFHAGECSTPPFNPGVFANMQKVAEVTVRLNGNKKEASANAALLSAAPELYEALEDFVQDYDNGVTYSESDMRKRIKIFRAALAKACGDSSPEEK